MKFFSRTEISPVQSAEAAHDTAVTLRDRLLVQLGDTEKELTALRGSVRVPVTSQGPAGARGSHSRPTTTTEHHARASEGCYGADPRRTLQIFARVLPESHATTGRAAALCARSQ